MSFYIYTDMTIFEKTYRMDMRQIILKLTGAMLLYFTPIAPLIHAVIALFIIDWITGIWKSLNNRRHFSSYRLRKSVEKGFSYMLAIITAHILSASLLDNAINIPAVVAGYIGFTELTSIYENLSDITGSNILRDVLKMISEKVKTKYIGNGKEESNNQ